MKVKTLVLLIILMHITGLLFAQEAKIVWDRIKGTQFKKAIEFIDNNNKIIKSIDLANENPYNHLDYEIEMINDAGHNSYKNISYDDLFPDKSIFNSEKIEGINSVYAYPIVNINNKIKEFVIITYKLATRHGDLFTGSLSTIEIYNSKGIKIKQYIDKSDMSSVRLTKNGEYILYSYGNSGGVDGSAIKEELGVKVLSLENDTLIIDRKFRTGFSPNNHYVKGNLFIISSTKYGDVKEDLLEIVHFDNRKIYSLQMPRSERMKLKKITKDGFIFGQLHKNDEKIKILTYEKDFLMEDF